MGREARRKIVQNTILHGKRHDNKILKVKILLSRNFVVIAQAPTLTLRPMKLIQNFPDFDQNWPKMVKSDKKRPRISSYL